MRLKFSERERENEKEKKFFCWGLQIIDQIIVKNNEWRINGKIRKHKQNLITVQWFADSTKTIQLKFMRRQKAQKHTHRWRQRKSMQRRDKIDIKKKINEWTTEFKMRYEEARQASKNWMFKGNMKETKIFTNRMFRLPCVYFCVSNESLV